MSTIMYQLTSGDTILRLSDNAFIPKATGNKDYREYLDWLAKGNTPEPAPPPPPPAPDYIAFWDALLISPVYQTIRSQALTSSEVLVPCTEFIAAISDAKAGRPNVNAVQACINLLIAGGTFTDEDRTELRRLLNAGNLDQIYTIP